MAARPAKPAAKPTGARDMVEAALTKGAHQRLSGSVCKETDDERGRRVRYGAHQMLKADPWSDCNPNFPMHSGKRSKH
jgi:hypothetical protein